MLPLPARRSAAAASFCAHFRADALAVGSAPPSPPGHLEASSATGTAARRSPSSSAASAAASSSAGLPGASARPCRSAAAAPVKRLRPISARPRLRTNAGC